MSESKGFCTRVLICFGQVFRVCDLDKFAFWISSEADFLRGIQEGFTGVFVVGA